MSEVDLTKVPVIDLLEELDRRSCPNVENVEKQIAGVIAYVEGWLWGRGYENASEFLRKEVNVLELIDYMLDDSCSPFPFAPVDPREVERRQRHLHWIADRLVHVHGESPNVDFVLRLREIADAQT